SFGVLRSAMAGQKNADGFQERVVVWATSKQRQEFIFAGGIIIVANRKPSDTAEQQALQTRIDVLHYQPTNEEIAALMRKIAAGGHRHGDYRLSPEEALEVADAVIERSSRLQRNLDLRLFVNTCQDRLQWSAGFSECHWLQLLDSRMKERVVAPSV